MTEGNGNSQGPGIREQVIVITLTKNGEITLKGPVDDSILFFGMLEVAKQSAIDYLHNKRDKESKVALATAPLPFAGFKNHKQ